MAVHVVTTFMLFQSTLLLPLPPAYFHLSRPWFSNGSMHGFGVVSGMSTEMYGERYMYSIGK